VKKKKGKKIVCFISEKFKGGEIRKAVKTPRPRKIFIEEGGKEGGM